MMNMLVIGTLLQYTVNMETIWNLNIAIKYAKYIYVTLYVDNWPDRYLFTSFKF